MVRQETTARAARGFISHLTIVVRAARMRSFCQLLDGGFGISRVYDPL
jgi:hypothetical protein